MNAAPRARAVARRGRDGTETRARIEAQALLLFAEKGVDGTSVRDIAQAVGVTEGALYRHFASKETLARELFLQHYAALAGEITAISARLPDLEGRVAAVVELACRMFDEEPALFAYLLINQHDHLRHVADGPSVNAVEAVGVMMRGGGVKEADVAFATATALGCVVQPAVFALYGRLQLPLMRHAPRITASILAALDTLRTASSPGESAGRR